MILRTVFLSGNVRPCDNTHKVSGFCQLLPVVVPMFCPCVFGKVETIFWMGRDGENRRRHTERYLCIFHICRPYTQRGLTYVDYVCDAG